MKNDPEPLFERRGQAQTQRPSTSITTAIRNINTALLHCKDGKSMAELRTLLEVLRSIRADVILY